MGSVMGNLIQSTRVPYPDYSLDFISKDIVVTVTNKVFIGTDTVTINSVSEDVDDAGSNRTTYTTNYR